MRRSRKIPYPVRDKFPLPQAEIPCPVRGKLPLPQAESWRAAPTTCHPNGSDLAFCHPLRCAPGFRFLWYDNPEFRHYVTSLRATVCRPLHGLKACCGKAAGNLAFVIRTSSFACRGVAQHGLILSEDGLPPCGFCRKIPYPVRDKFPLPQAESRRAAPTTCCPNDSGLAFCHPLRCAPGFRFLWYDNPEFRHCVTSLRA
ncbi:MAG: hypothetical protein IKV82_00155, partial [Akkermansia sp.]|nr:hypothetical protein [Akkermansia sp.]